MTPKPSVRILKTAGGTCGKDISKYADYPFAKLILEELDRLDTEHRRIAAKVDGHTTNAPAPTNDLEAALRKMPGVGPKLAELADGECLMGVGDGRGNLFVYGSHEAIVAVRNIVNDRDSARAECARLRGLIREFTESMTKTLNGGTP